MPRTKQVKKQNLKQEPQNGSENSEMLEKFNKLKEQCK